MATSLNQRDATVILTDPSKWIPWYRQLKMQCEALEIWDIVDPEGYAQPMAKPIEPTPPLVSSYEPAVTPRSTQSSSTISSRPGRGAARAATQEYEMRRQANRERLEQMRAYAETTGCRRELLLQYLGDSFEGPCDACDNCEAERGKITDPSAGTRREVA